MRSLLITNNLLCLCLTNIFSTFNSASFGADKGPVVLLFRQSVWIGNSMNQIVIQFKWELLISTHLKITQVIE